MITLHHLNQSRSKRIIWLLEELGVEYQIKAYQRDPLTRLAPPELKAIHPLGKSPVVELADQVLAESGAITETLIEQFAAEKLAPPVGTKDHNEYRQWLHFAESSAMVPSLLTLFLSMEPSKTEFLSGYAATELKKVMTYVDNALEGKEFLVAGKLTGADIMMSFIPEILASIGALAEYPNIARYYNKLQTLPHNQRASALEAEHQI